MFHCSTQNLSATPSVAIHILSSETLASSFHLLRSFVLRTPSDCTLEAALQAHRWVIPSMQRADSAGDSLRGRNLLEALGKSQCS